VISKCNPGSFSALLSRFIRDESGAEVIEAVLVVGLIAVICVIAMKGVSVALAQRWNQLLDIM
jgi:Flp pilus assembly pilin Flp